MNALTSPIAPNQSSRVDEYLAEIARLRAENAALTKAKVQTISLKVSEKGAVSVYGMGRFPVTLYAEQWTRLLDSAESIKAFIQAHKAELSSKADKAKAQTEGK